MKVEGLKLLQAMDATVYHFVFGKSAFNSVFIPAEVEELTGKLCNSLRERLAQWVPTLELSRVFAKVSRVSLKKDMLLSEHPFHLVCACPGSAFESNRMIDGPQERRHPNPVEAEHETLLAKSCICPQFSICGKKLDSKQAIESSLDRRMALVSFIMVNADGVVENEGSIAVCNMVVSTE